MAVVVEVVSVFSAEERPALMTRYGGGAYILGNGPTFTNCHFLNNEAERNGGGIYYDATEP